MRWLSNTALALAGIMAPFVAAYAALAAIIHERTARPPAMPTPNPVKAEIWRPGDLLVYVDPWFAGVLIHWLEFSFVLAAMVIAAGLCWAPVAKGKKRRLAVLSLLAGALIA